VQSNTSGKSAVAPGHFVAGGTREEHSVVSVLLESVVEVVTVTVVVVEVVVVEVVVVVTVVVVVEAVVVVV